MMMYSHKKFKKATLEACERKETELNCATPSHNVPNDESRPADNKSEVCSCNGYSNCFRCLQAFRSKGDYLRHKVLLSKPVQKQIPQEVKKATTLLCRSISLPTAPEATELPDFNLIQNEPKPIYKPKFRAQYSIEDDPTTSQVENYPTYYSLVSRDNTYHDLPVSSYTSSDHFGHVSGIRATDDVQKAKCAPLSRPTSSQGIWKGIKSPSPELVGQHITNLIVQNKAIVETNNSLWPMKYKRHSSVGSILDGDSLSKGKRSSETKGRNYSRSKSPYSIHDDGNIDHKILTNYSVNHQASNFTSSAHSVATIRQLKYDARQPTKEGPSILTDASQSTTHQLTRQQTKPVVSIARHLSMSLSESGKMDACNHCGMLVESNSMLHHIKKYGCKRSFFLELSAEGKKMHQAEALDLQTKKGFIRTDQFTPDNQNHMDNIPYKEPANEKDSDTVTSLHKIGNISSPTLNIKHKNVEFSNVVLSNVHLSNGSMYQLKDYGSRGMDELHQPKPNSHHIYGGEVKICDGNAFRTLKIDSTKSEKPSLDLCIASQHLGAKQPSLEDHPPTSLVVKFATCGLNSGGTMVKFDSHRSHNTAITGNSQTTSGFYVAPVERNLVYRNDATVSNSLTKNTALTLIRLSSPNATPLCTEGLKQMPIGSSCTSINDTGSLSISSSSPLRKESPYKTPMQPYSSKTRKNTILLPISVEKIPHVPGIPGPYSQLNGVIPVRQPADGGSLLSDESSNCLNTGNELTISTAKIRSDHIKFVCPDKIKDSRSSAMKYDSVISIESISSENDLKSREHPETPDPNNESCFLVPRKRPSTLTIKPTQLNSKSSLIGSTLVSPDTPRPKKSCAQLLLNGSAYTYLNMKVSTKTFFCCIYRPQPMYVLQATNPKLSMYSNWQVRKTDEPLNLSPAKLMSLHVSGVYHDRAYTIAEPKNSQMIVTDSSPDMANCRSVPERHLIGEVSLHTAEGDSNKRRLEDDGSDENVGKRVKIFEGGFKTNEDYTYVRGRGRGRYVCETCGIRCKKPSMLKKHIRTHTDLRPFACSHCSFSFKTKGNLTKHLKSKAHYKRCTEMGIRPVPTVVDDTHINKEALELQGKIDLTINSCQSADDEDDSEDDNDESDDDEFDEFDDDEKYTERSQTLHITACDNLSDEGHDEQNDGPMDLSVKRNVDKHKRPKTLTLPPTAVGLTSGPPTLTPIKENPDEILSPVTESSHLLKSIYDTTLKVAKVTERTSNRDPGKDMGCGGSMLQNYLREIAVLDRARKRKYIRVTECHDVQPKRARVLNCDEPPVSNTASISEITTTTGNSPTTAGEIAAAIVFSCEETATTCRSALSSPFAATTVVLSSKKRELSPSTYRSSSSQPNDSIVHTMPSVPANMVVINTSGTHSKTAFMSPSGVIPTSLNRPGCDDGKSKCAICQKEFGKQSQLSLHMNIHYIERPHRCESCGVSFRTSGHLQKHMRSVSHYNKLNMNMTFGTPSTENPRPFKCHDCKSAFRIHGHLAKHLRSKLHIMRLECLGKLPFGTYAEIERSGISLNEIDTSDCENSLDSLQVMASKLYEKDPSKLSEWTAEVKTGRIRTVSNSSNNSDEYLLEDEPELKQAEDESESGFDDDLAEGGLESSTNDEEITESEAVESEDVPIDASKKSKPTG